MPKSIDITITTDGSVTVEANGFKGKGCEAATKFIEEALGTSKGKRKLKPEFYQQAGTTQKIGN